jgi:phosphopantothenoylcysteine decarboxylase/phosphopantothenate--cysteine ligase
MVHVNTAAEMLAAAIPVFEESHIAIFSAAVADYRPAQVASEKLKKEEQIPSIVLEKTVDILQTLGTAKGRQIVVGFALETRNEEENARKKLERKNADLIVLNSLRDEGAGFGGDTNKVTLLTRNKTVPLKLMSKAETAAGVLDFIIEEFL